MSDDQNENNVIENEEDIGEVVEFISLDDEGGEGG